MVISLKPISKKYSISSKKSLFDPIYVFPYPVFEFSYVVSLSILNKGKIGTYWANTCSNGLVSKLVREGNIKIKTAFEQLLKGEIITCTIDEQIVYNQLDRSAESIWSLLLASGYLKVLSYEEKRV